MTCTQMTSLGAYVLGALDGPERQALEEHLRECAHCRDELVRLAPLPGLLAQVSLDELGEPEGDLVREPVSAWTSPRDAQPWWRRARVLAAAAAVVAVLAGVGVAGVVVVGPTETTTATTWSTSPSSTGIDATATLSARGWGTDVQLVMEDLPAGQRCRLVVWSDDGRAETAGWWTTGYSTSAEVPASTSIDLGSIDRMEVHAGNQVLAVLQP